MGAILYVNNKVLTARFNGRTVESLILRNSLISKSDSFLTTHNSEIGFPLLESVQRIMIRTEVFGKTISAKLLDRTCSTALRRPRRRGGRQIQ